MATEKAFRRWVVMEEAFWEIDPRAPYATLIRVACTYCHPEADEDAYDSLKRLVKREDYEEIKTFKAELRKALLNPDVIPDDELYEAVQFDDGSEEKFLRRLWRDLYPDEPVPSSPR